MDGEYAVSHRAVRSAVFMGSKPFGLAVLKALVAAEPSLKWQILHPDDLSDARSNFNAFQEFSETEGVSLTRVRSRAEAESLLAECDYDVGFVCGWYWLLGEKIVGPDAPPVYGIHNSLLPRYRGGAPLVWSIINGESEVGGSLFRLTLGMDDGDIALQVKVPVTQDSDIGSILEEIEVAFLKGIPTVWQDIVSGRPILTRQNHSLATYCAQRRPEDGQINWSDSAQSIHDFIRAQSRPYPCAYTFCDADKIYLDRAEVFPGCYYGRPGQIVERKRTAITVTAGGGTAVRIIQAHDTSGETDLRTLFPAGVRLLKPNSDDVFL